MNTLKSNSELETLKRVLSNSSKCAFILNYEFDVLWCSKNDMLSTFGSDTFKYAFRNKDKPLKSGDYLFERTGLEFQAHIINYPDKELYIVLTNRDDVIFSYLESNDSVRNLLENQAAQIREALNGIYFAMTTIRNNLDNTTAREYSEYFDITTGNCQKVLGIISDIIELIKYIQPVSEPFALDISHSLENIVNICNSILKFQYDIYLSAESDLCIMTDPERFSSCILSLIVLTIKNNPGCRSVSIDAEKFGENVSITVSSGIGEETLHEMMKENLFSKFNRYYNNNTNDLDIAVIYRFCSTYNGMFFSAEDPGGDGTIYSLKLPCCDRTVGNDDNSLNVGFKSSNSQASSGMFTKYRTALSKIADAFK